MKECLLVLAFVKRRNDKNCAIPSRQLPERPLLCRILVVHRFCHLLSEIRERPGLVSALASGEGELKEAGAAEAEAAAAEKLKAKHTASYISTKKDK